MKKLPFVGALLIVMSFVFFSCNGGDDGSTSPTGDPYDPNKPVSVTRFYPEYGGMFSKIILEGSNFGNKEKEVKVYFNDKRAGVVRSIGNMIYAIVPRQPGDTCKVSVIVGNDSVAYSKDFLYYTTTIVSTVAGVPNTEDADRTGGTLSAARFSVPKYLTCDTERNVYLLDWANDWGANKSTCYLINEVSDIVMALGDTKRCNAPCMDPTGTKILLPADDAMLYYEFNKLAEYSQRKMNPIKVDGSLWPVQYKHGLAPCTVDGLIYSWGRFSSYIFAIDQNKKESYLVYDATADNTQGMLAFDPLNPEWLYISQYNIHSISRFNVVTKEYELFAGSKGSAGHADGDRFRAQFNMPRQICFDYDGNLFIADSKNHCIRKISPQGIVSTVIGIPGKAGYIDGGPDYALFNEPEGVTVTTDNIVWIADTGNDVLRKLAIE